MVTLDLEPEIEERVKRHALENQVSEVILIREVLLKWLEDREDYAAGIESLEQQSYTVSLEELERRDALED